MLLIAQEPEDCRQLREILSEEYGIMAVSSASEALTYMQNHSQEITAAILNMDQPDVDGEDLLKRCQGVFELRSLPLVAASRDTSGEMEKRCLSLGAWDYVCKPYQGEILRIRLRNVIDRSLLETAKRLKYLADFDPMVGIYNKRRFFEAARELIDANPEKTFALVHYDIRCFQLINTLFGEAEGNRFIGYVAQRLMQYGEEHPLCRYGHLDGDQFAVCVPYTTRERLLESIARAEQEVKDYPLNFAIVPVFGVALVDQSNRDMEIGRLFDRAILAGKYCKSEENLDCCRFFEEFMESDALRVQALMRDAERALREEQFELYLQPKYSLREECFVGAEALVRWRHPEQGMIPPGEFIPVFEKNGWIAKLDRYICEHVCQLLRRWLDEGKKPHPISFNLSRVSLHAPNLENEVMELVSKYRIPVSLLQLELTESAYTTNPALIEKKMARFQELGFSILMDDFGSGYSSLNILKDLAVDILKVDMKFLTKGPHPGRGEMILASVIRMAKWLMLPVIMEGVETEKQVSFLQEIGCEWIQGDYFSPAVPIEEYERLMSGQSQDGAILETERHTNMEQLWKRMSAMEFFCNGAHQAMGFYEYFQGQCELLRVNTEYRQRFGDSDLDLPRRSLLEQVVPEDRETLRRALQTAAVHLGSSECVYRRIEDGVCRKIRIRLMNIAVLDRRSVIFGMLELLESYPCGPLPGLPASEK